ncbi:hypothetical protein EMPS_01236 [Entomortierella parvispora]|uniref:Uncharacterized protein n=1 Tax=Entomortierella parvispora TaxID=205924 RepID=A0A9P3LSR9_9FUNG|nr:hypothetical protein EMPS_01236 [Entomortierella parvispora]
MADLDLSKLERPEGVEDDSKVQRCHSDVHAESQDHDIKVLSPESSLPEALTKTTNDVPLETPSTITPRSSTVQDDHLCEGQTDDPHGTAAMALAVLSSGVGIQGAAPFDRTAGGRSAFSSRDEESGEKRMDRPIRLSTDDSLDSETLNQHRSSQQKQQRRRSLEDVDYRSTAERQPLSPSTFRSTMPLNRTVVRSSPLDTPQDPFATAALSPETPIKPGALNEQVEENASQVSGPRMQSLSHLLRARLSLVSLQSDNNWDKHDPVEDNLAPDQDHPDLLQRRGQMQDRYNNTLPKHHQDLSGAPPVASPSYKQTTHRQEGDRAYVYAAQHPGESQRIHAQHLPQRIQQPGPSFREQPGPSFREHQATGEDSKSPLSVYSPTMESVLVKPKRKYTKRAPVSQHGLSEAGSVRIPMDDIPAVPESELLQSDRGLVLKTQIPKKGRPISKHPSAASQSTPTLSSFGVLPASHPYFNSSGATGVPFEGPQSSFAASTSLTNRNAYVGRPPELHHIYSLAQDNIRHRHLPQEEQQMQVPVRRKPGRPPLTSTVARHSHSQSHSSLQSGPFSPGPLFLTGRSQSSSIMRSQPPLHDPPHYILSKDRDSRGTLVDNSQETSTRGSFIHYRDPSPPLSVTSSSTATSSQRGPAKRHSYPLSMENRQYPHDFEYRQQRSSHRLVESPTEIEHHAPMVQRSSSPQEYEREMPVGLVRSFAEGYTPQNVNISSISSGRKRSSSGAAKGPNDGPGASANNSQYDGDERTLSSFSERTERSFDFGPNVENARARKRISRPESRAGDTAECGLQDESEFRSTWTGPCRGRPRSSTALSIQSNLANESAFMVRGRSPVHYEVHAGSRDSESELRHQPGDVHMTQGRGGYQQHGVHPTHHHGHAHSRSLDLSFMSRRPTAAQREQQFMVSEDVLDSRGVSPGGSESLMSPPLISPTFPPVNLTGIGQQRSRSELFYGRHHEPEMPLPHVGMAKTTMADMLARQMSSSTMSSRVITSILGSTASRSILTERGRGRGAGQVIKTTPKRSTKKGPGPHLKKHQILQQQLHQMQREQEELEIQQALQLRQQQQQEEEYVRGKPTTMHHQRPHTKSIAPPPPSQRHQHHGELPVRHHSHPYHPQQPQPGRPPKQRVLMRSESASSVLQSPLSPQFQSYPSTLSPSHPRQSSCASSLGSGRGGGGSGSGVSSTNTPSPSSTATSKRRQNQQQTIMLRPVSLPTFVGAGGGLADDSGSPLSISSSSTSSTSRAVGQFFHSQGGPPPGQPLYRSLPVLSPLSPYQLAPSNTQGSLSASMAPGISPGQESGGGQISGTKFSHLRYRRSTEHSLSEDRTATVHPSPRSSPSALLASPQSVGGPTMSSGPSGSRSDIHGQGSTLHHHQQYPPQSQSSYRPRVSSASAGNLASASSSGGLSTARSTSLSLDAALASRRGGEMSACSSSSTLYHQDTDMSTSSSLTSLSSLSSLPTLSHRHSQSSFSTTSLSSSTLHQEKQLRLQSVSSSTSSTPYLTDSSQQQQRTQLMEDMEDPRSAESPASVANRHYHHYQHHPHQHHPSAHSAMTKTASADRPPLPPALYPPRSTTPTPTSTPTPTLGPTPVRTEE